MRSDEPVEAFLCQTRWLILRPGTLYRFFVDPGCKWCAEMGAHHPWTDAIRVEPHGSPRLDEQSGLCEGCGEWVPIPDVTPHGGHAVWSTHDGYTFASECGPVSRERQGS